SAAVSDGNNLKKASGFLKSRCGGITCLFKRESVSAGKYLLLDSPFRPLHLSQRTGSALQQLTKLIRTDLKRMIESNAGLSPASSVDSHHASRDFACDILCCERFCNGGRDQHYQPRSSPDIHVRRNDLAPALP